MNHSITLETFVMMIASIRAGITSVIEAEEMAYSRAIKILKLTEVTHIGTKELKEFK